MNYEWSALISSSANPYLEEKSFNYRPLFIHKVSEIIAVRRSSNNLCTLENWSVLLNSLNSWKLSSHYGILAQFFFSSSSTGFINLQLNLFLDICNTFRVFYQVSFQRFLLVISSYEIWKNNDLNLWKLSNSIYK